MFTQRDAAEALQSNKAAELFTRRREAKRLSKIMRPWFEGLNTFLDPFVVDPTAPKASLHEEHYAAWTWAVQVGMVVPNAQPDVALMTTLFLDAQGRPTFNLDIHTLKGSNADRVNDIRDGILEYAHETLSGPYLMVQTTAQFKGLDLE